MIAPTPEGSRLVADANTTQQRLDEEPIIAQGVEALDHARHPKDLLDKGRDIECQTLANAIGYHLEQRVFLNANHSVVLHAKFGGWVSRAAA